MIRSNEVARHLRKLGCNDEQVRGHIARGEVPATVMRLRPRPLDWLSWATRIRNADPRG
jgi:hypothetical protein